ncbi:50S ribosomal protein L22 [candidate division WOR-3 bacterium]|nr:50S ribosomal protein L22 [candidate division WOR-3 bacterium]
MEGKCISKFVRVSPAKAKRVVDLVKNKDINTAIAILEHIPNSVAIPIMKAIHSAVSNVISQAGEIKLKEEDLFLKLIKIDTGSSKYLKRLRPRAMGRADVIRHRTSHISIVVAEKGKKEE